MTFDPKSPERYSRQVRVPGIGKTGQERIGKSRVTLCGCGALGTVIANHLVRAGVGFVRIVDRDFVEPSNLQRQVLFGVSSVGEDKVKAAAKRLKDLNPDVKVVEHKVVVNSQNVMELVRDYEALEADERTINVHISHIRDKIEPDPAQPRFIKTVRGVGYAFSED